MPTTEDPLEAENSALRELLGQAALDASRLLAQAGINATEKEAAERLQRLLLEELHHRVKTRSPRSWRLHRKAYEMQPIWSKDGRPLHTGSLRWGGPMICSCKPIGPARAFRQSVRAAIEPFDTPGTRRFVVQVVEIKVGPAAVLSLAMALNELCRNAVKYGALSNAEGYVEITSMLDEDTHRFKLIWEEKGGPVVKEPTRRSFGTRLIETSLARLLHGDARLRFEPSGVIGEFDFPIASLYAAHPNEKLPGDRFFLNVRSLIRLR